MASGSRLTFFGAVFVLSIPFWVIGTLTDLQLLPGLPVAALAVVCPATAAMTMVYRDSGSAGVKALLERTIDYRKIGLVWYAPLVLLIPGLTTLSYGLMRLLEMPVPPPRIPIVAALAMFLAFVIGAIGEELGWSAYATDAMLERWGALQAGIVVGLVWAAWHFVPLLQAHRSLAWIGWWSLNTVALRILLIWLYKNTGRSVFAAILFHTISNLSWQLFPNYGSHWDPRIVAPITALTAAIITIAWGPRTLARFTFASRRNSSAS